MRKALIILLLLVLFSFSGCDNSSNNDTGSNSPVVAEAYSKIGCPYEWGAAGPDSFDASGLVCFCYGHRSHIWTTNTFVSQQAGWEKINVSEAMPGDVVSSNDHCGIYIGGGHMIHAPQFGDVVKIGSIQGDMSYYRYSPETE